MVLTMMTVLTAAPAAMAHHTPNHSQPILLAQAAAEEPLPIPTGLSVDLRQQMRAFIQSISKFTRRYHPNFFIITRGGLELLIKRDPVEEIRYSPARTYMRSINGVLMEGLYLWPKGFR